MKTKFKTKCKRALPLVILPCHLYYSPFLQGSINGITVLKLKSKGSQKCLKELKKEKKKSFKSQR